MKRDINKGRVSQLSADVSDNYIFPKSKFMAAQKPNADDTTKPFKV